MAFRRINCRTTTATVLTATATATLSLRVCLCFSSQPPQDDDGGGTFHNVYGPRQFGTGKPCVTCQDTPHNVSPPARAAEDRQERRVPATAPHGGKFIVHRLSGVFNGGTSRVCRPCRVAPRDLDCLNVVSRRPCASPRVAGSTRLGFMQNVKVRLVALADLNFVSVLQGKPAAIVLSERTKWVALVGVFCMRVSKLVTGSWIYM